VLDFLLDNVEIYLYDGKSFIDYKKGDTFDG